MLTKIREFDTWNFSLWGTEKRPTDVFKYVERSFDEKEGNRLATILEMINTSPYTFQHPYKFKQLESDVWELKFRSGNRIACIWENDHTCLVGFYGFMKKDDKWPKDQMRRMRNAKKRFLKEKMELNMRRRK